MLRLLMVKQSVLTHKVGTAVFANGSRIPKPTTTVWIGMLVLNRETTRRASSTELNEGKRRDHFPLHVTFLQLPLQPPPRGLVRRRERRQENIDVAVADQVGAALGDEPVELGQLGEDLGAGARHRI